MSWKAICSIIVVLGVFLLVISREYGKNQKKALIISIENSMKTQYQSIIEDKRLLSIKHPSNMSPNDLTDYFLNDLNGFQKMPSFVKQNDILLPSQSVVVPSDKILFAVRLSSKSACAITCSGEIKMISLDLLNDYEVLSK